MQRTKRRAFIALAALGLIVSAVFVIIGASKNTDTQAATNQPNSPAALSPSRPNPLVPKAGPPVAKQQPRAPGKTHAHGGSGTPGSVSGGGTSSNGSGSSSSTGSGQNGGNANSNNNGGGSGNVGSVSSVSGGGSGGSGQSSNSLVAVQTAAKAVANLASAVFLTGNELNQAVSMVVPSEQAKIARGLQQDGYSLACALGYSTTNSGKCQPDILKAENNAQYYVSVMEYKVENASRTRATIDLYFISYFVTAGGQSYTIPDITVVDMVNQNGQWWFKDQRDPPSGATPANIGGLSTQQVEQLYQNKYLGGYQNYVPQ